MATLTTVQCPILVGRDDVLELADTAIAEAAHGRGRTLLRLGSAAAAAVGGWWLWMRLAPLLAG